MGSSGLKRVEFYHDVVNKAEVRRVCSLNSF